MSDRVRRDSDGFTLLEILVALAILAVSVPILMTTLGNGLRRTSSTDLETSASALAQSLLAKVGTEMTLVDGKQAGQFEGGFRWKLQVTPYGDQQDQDAWQLRAHQVMVQVRWNDGAAERRVALTTLRLAPRGRQR